jgi:hypothetical protein
MATIHVSMLRRYRFGIQDANSPLVAVAQSNWFIESAATQVKLRLLMKDPQVRTRN